MPTLELSPGNTLAFDYSPPGPQGFTFVCFNALTGDKAMWSGILGDAASNAGHGLLLYNLRGQAGSEFASKDINETSIVADAKALLDHVRPPRPIFVGLSIGGLFALRVHLAGGDYAARGTVLINTLRKPGPRLDWVNDAALTAARTGGLEMMRDLFAPLLFNKGWLAENRAGFLTADTYEGLSEEDGSYLLLAAGGTSNWDLPYEELSLPILSMTGEQDRMFRDAADIDDLLGRLPNARRLDLANAGHMLPIERPGEFAEALLSFANTLSAA